MYSRHPDPRRVWKGGSEQHLLTPLPGDPGDPGAPRAPGASSKKLDVAVFYHEFDTVALPFFVEKLYVDGFCNDFQPKNRLLAISNNIPYYMLSIFVKKSKTDPKKNSVHFSTSAFWKKPKSDPKKNSVHFSFPDSGKNENIQ